MAYFEQKITPFLWFNKNAEKAVDFYIKVFNNSSLGSKSRYGESGSKVSGNKKDSIMTIEFEIEGTHFTAINGGPEFKFTPAISFLISCKNQNEVDYYWENLSKGGKKIQCGWIEDKFGISWQIVPTQMYEYLMSEDKIKSEKAMSAMLKMKKLDINKIKEAFDS